MTNAPNVSYLGADRCILQVIGTIRLNGDTPMTDANTATYYRHREQRERGLAAAANNPAIAAIHREMAERYEKLVDAAPPRNGVRI